MFKSNSTILFAAKAESEGLKTDRQVYHAFTVYIWFISDWPWGGSPYLTEFAFIYLAVVLYPSFLSASYILLSVLIILAAKLVMKLLLVLVSWNVLHNCSSAWYMYIIL
jgi:hypothetical protein